jgi:hypothetical protein
VWRQHQEQLQVPQIQAAVVAVLVEIQPVELRAQVVQAL